MLIKIIKSTVCGGDNVKADDEINVDAREGKLLIRMGKAIEVRKTLALKVESEKKAIKKKSKRKSKDKEE